MRNLELVAVSTVGDAVMKLTLWGKFLFADHRSTIQGAGEVEQEGYALTGAGDPRFVDGPDVEELCSLGEGREIHL